MKNWNKSAFLALALAAVLSVPAYAQDAGAIGSSAPATGMAQMRDIYLKIPQVAEATKAIHDVFVRLTPINLRGGAYIPPAQIGDKAQEAIAKVYVPQPVLVAGQQDTSVNAYNESFTKTVAKPVEIDSPFPEWFGVAKALPTPYTAMASGAIGRGQSPAPAPAGNIGAQAN